MNYRPPTIQQECRRCDFIFASESTGARPKFEVLLAGWEGVGPVQNFQIANAR